MAGWSVLLAVPPEARTADTVSTFYEFVEDKREQYCDGTEPLRIDERRQRDLARLTEEGQFIISVPVYKQLREHIEWVDVQVLMDDDWTVRGGDIADLAALFRRGTERLSARDSEWHYECFSETGVVAVCEFALRNGYAVEILD